MIKEEKIFVVQARPINRTQSLPTYLDIEASPLQNPTEAKVLVPGSNAAFIIDKPGHVLIEDSLEKAGDILKPEHRLVITRNEEPINSHGVIQMTELNMPCFYHKDGLDSLISELQHGKPLAVCPQQGVVALLQGEAIIREGYITHPAPLSCLASSVAHRKNSHAIPKELYALLKQVRLEQNTKVAFVAFEKLANHPLLKMLPKRVTYKPLKQLAKEMQKRVHKTLKELGQALNQNKDRLQILFFAKALETLLWGDGYSVIHLEKLSLALSAYEEKLGRKPLLAEESLIQPLMPETGEAWVAFLITLEKNHPLSDIEALKTLLDCIGSVRSRWLTFFFDRARKQALSSQELLRVLLSGFDAPSQVFINELRKKEKMIDHFKVDLFSDSSAQTYAFMQLKAFIQQFENPQTLVAFQQASPLAKIIAAQILDKAVTLYDKAIKTMKLNTPLELRASLFQEMLGPFLSLLRGVSLQLIGEGVFPGISLETYLDRIKQTIEKPLDFGSTEALEESVTASRNFAVLAAMLGSGTAFERHLPVTLEDCFTLIHQNLLACISFILSKNIPFTEVTLPALFHETMDQVNAFREKSIQLLGVDQDFDQLKLKFNAPLRNHSSTFQLIFKENKVFLSAQLLGQARNRWTQTNQYLQMLDAIGLQPLSKKTYQRGDVLDFTWCFKNTEQFAYALDVLHVVYEFSLAERLSLLTNDILSRISRECATESEENEAYEKIAEQVIHFNWSNLVYTLIDRRKILDKIKNIALDLAHSSALPAKRKGCQLLCKLTTVGVAYEETSKLVDTLFAQETPAMGILAMQLIHALVDQGESLNQAIHYAKDKIDDPYDTLFNEIVSLWEKLSPPCNINTDSALNSKQKLELVLHAYCQLANSKATESTDATFTRFISDEDPLVRMRTVELMTQLVEKGKALEFGLVLAKILSICDNDSNVQAAHIILLQRLAEKEQDLEQINYIALEIMPKVYPEAKQLIVPLLRTLINKHVITSKTIETITALSHDSDHSIRTNTLQLVLLLVQKKLFFKEALEILGHLWKVGGAFNTHFIKVLEQLILNDFECDKISVMVAQLTTIEGSLMYRQALLNLFVLLVQRGYGNNEAFAAAKKVIEINILNTEAFAVLKELLNQGFAIKEIGVIAEKHVISKNPASYFVALSVLTSFATNHLSSEECVALFTKITVNNPKNVAVRKQALNFFSLFIKRGEAIEDIIKAATKFVYLADELATLSGFLIFEDLLKHGYAREKATAIVEQFVDSEDLLKRDFSLNLKRILTGAPAPDEDNSLWNESVSPATPDDTILDYLLFS